MSTHDPAIFLPRDPHHEFVRVTTHAITEKRTEDYDEALGRMMPGVASRRLGQPASRSVVALRCAG